MQNVWHPAHIAVWRAKHLFYIAERGHEVTVKAADDPSLQLSRFGEYIYQNLVILAPGVEEFGGALSVEVN